MEKEIGVSEEEECAVSGLDFLGCLSGVEAEGCGSETS